MDSETATLTCTVSNLLKETTVEWYNGEEKISTDDTTNYVTTVASLSEKSKAPTLQITSAKLKALSVSTDFKCSIVVDEQTVDSEAVTLIILGEFIIGFNEFTKRRKRVDNRL